jgi:hypothetical protein
MKHNYPYHAGAARHDINTTVYHFLFKIVNSYSNSIGENLRLFLVKRAHKQLAGGWDERDKGVDNIKK